MRIEVLLKQIRKEKRCKFTTTFENDRNFNFTLELYRKKWIDIKELYRVIQ